MPCDNVARVREGRDGHGCSFAGVGRWWRWQFCVPRRTGFRSGTQVSFEPDRVLGPRVARIALWAGGPDVEPARLVFRDPVFG